MRSVVAISSLAMMSMCAPAFAGRVCHPSVCLDLPPSPLEIGIEENKVVSNLSLAMGTLQFSEHTNSVVGNVAVSPYGEVSGAVGYQRRLTTQFSINASVGHYNGSTAASVGVTYGW